MSARVHTLDDVAQEACEKAIAYNRAGRPGRAHYELVRAGMKIAKIVDDRPSFDVLTDLRLFEPFRDTRAGDAA